MSFIKSVTDSREGNYFDIVIQHGFFANGYEYVKIHYGLIEEEMSQVKESFDDWKNSEYYQLNPTELVKQNYGVDIKGKWNYRMVLTPIKPPSFCPPCCFVIHLVCVDDDRRSVSVPFAPNILGGKLVGGTFTTSEDKNISPLEAHCSKCSWAKIDTTRHFLVIGTVSCEFEVVFKEKVDLEDALKEYDERMTRGMQLPLEFIEGCKVLQINQYLINDYCKHPTKRFIITPQLIQYITVREVS